MAGAKPFDGPYQHNACDGFIVSVPPPPGWPNDVANWPAFLISVLPFSDDAMLLECDVAGFDPAELDERSIATAKMLAVMPELLAAAKALCESDAAIEHASVEWKRLHAAIAHAEGRT